MAKYLRTSGISAELENLIREAQERVYIISPYLKLSDNIRQLLNDKEREKVEVRIIFGKQELNPTEMTYLEKLKYVRIFYSKNLHAKCYLNETKMIITSMNLYEFSQQNNREMGIIVDKTQEVDKEVYEDAWKDIQSILHNAEDFAYVKAPLENEKLNKQESKTDKASATGYCIKTGIKIPFNIEKPMSYDAYKTWNKNGDKNHPEKFCHFSGELSNGETSVNKPIMKKNWKKAQEVYGLK